MIYAVKENDKINVYSTLPKGYHSSYGNVLGGFHLLSEEDLSLHGFYPVEEPIIEDPLFKRKGDIYFDEDSKLFKYHIVNISHPDLDEMKKQKLNSLKLDKKFLLEETNDDVIEALELGNEIPNEIASTRSKIRKKYKEIKEKIESLSNQRDLLNFKESIIII